MSKSLVCEGFPVRRPTRTKIVATVGPASESAEMLRSLMAAGVDVFRLNMAHGDPTNTEPVVERIRKVSAEVGLPVAILADLAGPKMRLGVLPGGEFDCVTGGEIAFVRGETSDQPGRFATTYEPLIDDLAPGDRVLLADGTVTLSVLDKTDDAVRCRVVQGGKVRSRQGINLPGVKLSIKTLGEADIRNARWAVTAGIDFLGLSFVRSPDDIRELRAILEQAAAEHFGTDAWKKLSDQERRVGYPDIIAKIEKPETLDCLDEIIEEADGAMVARGDLGVEVNIARIALIQKEIIRACHRLTKPVIVATQMLESMTTEIMPTRAEATDVANAILDGADACMLSGESAIGKYPVEAVEMMHAIAEETERHLARRRLDSACFDTSLLDHVIENDDISESVKISVALCDAAGALADTIGASMLVVATKTGRTALNLSKMRNEVFTVGSSPDERVLRRLCLYWGVLPLAGLSTSLETMIPQLVSRAKNADCLVAGDTVVWVAGVGINSDDRNAIYVHRVE